MTYSQTTGLFTFNGSSATGYAGHGAGLNSPAMQNVKGVGPLPQGLYTIGPPHADEHTGPVSMRLTPDPANEMFGRGDFLIHGPHQNDNHDSSDGCIVLPHNARVEIGSAVLAGSSRLTVTA